MARILGGRTDGFSLGGEDSASLVALNIAISQEHAASSQHAPTPSAQALVLELAPSNSYYWIHGPEPTLPQAAAPAPMEPADAATNQEPPVPTPENFEPKSPTPMEPADDPSLSPPAEPTEPAEDAAPFNQPLRDLLAGLPWPQW